MVHDSPRRAKKRANGVVTPLVPVTVMPRTSSNQYEVSNVASSRRGGSARRHTGPLAQLQLQLPSELVFQDSQTREYRLHVNLSGWRVTDAMVQQLQLSTHGLETSPANFLKLTLDADAHVSVRGLELLLHASTELRVLRLPRCQLLSHGGGGGACPLSSEVLPRSLTELDVSYCEWVDDRFLRTLARSCPALTQLSVAHCRRVTDYGVAAFADAGVAHLDVSHCSRLTDTTLLALLVGSTAPVSGSSTPGTAPVRLRVVRAAGLPLLDGLTVLGLRGPCASRLETLEVAGCSALRVAALERLAQVHALTQLRSLDLSRCARVDDRALRALGTACLELQTLKLAFCSGVTDCGLRWLVGVATRAVDDEDSPRDGDEDEVGAEAEAEDAGDGAGGCRQLRTLELSGCFRLTSRGVAALGMQCRRLQWLGLDGVRRLDVTGLRVVLQRCAGLRTLRWSGILVRSGQQEAAVESNTCAAFFSMPQLNHATLTALTGAGVALQTLHMANTQCDGDALAAAIQLGRQAAAELRDVDVSSLATDALCKALGMCCPQLRTLRLSRSRYFSSDSLLAVFQSCSALRTLELESCEQLQDEALLALGLSPCCASLETLVLAHDWQLSDRGVESLLGPAVRLRRLDVRHCPEITLRTLQRLAAARGHLSEATRDGLTPRHPNVAAFLQRDQTRRTAACRITRWLRGRLDVRVSAKATLEQSLAALRRQKRAATRVQRWLRRLWADWKQRELLAEARRQRRERCDAHWAWIHAWCVLSCRLRVLARQFTAARRRAELERAEQHRVLCEKAATVIQTTARGWLARRRAVEARYEREQRRKRREAAATNVQRVLRGHQTRRRVAQWRLQCHNELHSAIKREHARFLSALQLQCVVRGFLGRQRAAQAAVEAYELLQLQIRRASQIQRAYRAYVARVALHNLLFHGATALQQVFRGFCGRRQARETVLARAYAQEPRILILQPHAVYTRELAVQWKHKRDAGEQVAAWLQRYYRGFCGRREMRLRLAARRQRDYRQDAGARTLQHFFRSILIVVRLARLQALLRLRRRSATHIQATWRMWLAKALAASRRLRNDRRRRHTALLEVLASPQQHRRLFLQRGAAHSIVTLFRASLAARGWQTPTFVALLHRSAARIQALARGRMGRLYASWLRETWTSAASVLQRVWRGKMAKKLWRALMAERQQLRRAREEGDRAARIAQKLTAQHALAAQERETKHAVVLQRWFRTLRQRQVFREARERQQRLARQRAEQKLGDVLRLSTQSVVFQARVWRDCTENRSALTALEESECVVMESELQQLRQDCLDAHAASSSAAQEFALLTRRRHEFERSRASRRRATEALKAQVQPFAKRAKQLTVESARQQAATRQLQFELRRAKDELRSFHTLLHQRLPLEPLLLCGDVEALLAGLGDNEAEEDEGNGNGNGT